jgi:SAM-dependent methyltransferase
MLGGWDESLSTEPSANPLGRRYGSVRPRAEPLKMALVGHLEAASCIVRHNAPVGFYDDQILPRLINRILVGREFTKIRGRVASGLTGEVLEVGFGSGLNVPHYPSDVDRVLAVDPAKVGRKLAAGRLATTSIPVEYIDLDGGSLPVDSGSVDHVLITWTMCTIPDINSGLGEIRRVLRPGGEMHFVEHGLSPDPKVAKWQDRLTPLHSRWAGGCHLNRPIDRLIEEAGFTVTCMDNYYTKGPRPMGYMFEGLATRS